MNVVSIGLTVFGPNKAAQSLYEDLGFEVTVLQDAQVPLDGPRVRPVLVVLLDNGTARHHTSRDDLGRSRSGTRRRARLPDSPDKAEVSGSSPLRPTPPITL